jgi:hypothetical protein
MDGLVKGLVCVDVPLGEREDLPHAHPDEHVALAELALVGLEVTQVLLRFFGEPCASSSLSNRSALGFSGMLCVVLSGFVAEVPPG